MKVAGKLTSYLSGKCLTLKYVDTLIGSGHENKSQATVKKLRIF
jgi:hypothetical protein